MDNQPGPGGRGGSALGRLVVVLVCVATLAGLLAAVVLHYRDTQLCNREAGLTQAVLAMRAYDELYGHAPPPALQDATGRVLGSWRFAVLPLLESQPPPVNTNVPWDAPQNEAVASKPLGAFCFSGSAVERLETNVFAVVGNGTAFDPDCKKRLRDLPHDVILLVEVANSGVHWMAPGDLDIADASASIRNGLDGRGFHIAFNDQVVWYLTPDVPWEDVKRFFSVAGAMENDRELLRPYVLRARGE